MTNEADRLQPRSDRRELPNEENLQHVAERDKPDWEGTNLARVLRARIDPVYDITFGEGYRLQIGPSEARTALDVYPQAAVVRFTSRDIQLELHRLAPPVLENKPTGEASLTFKSQQDKGGSMFTVTAEGESSMIILTQGKSIHELASTKSSFGVSPNRDFPNWTNLVEFSEEDEKRLPLGASIFHILVSILDKARHGYEMIREISERTNGKTVIGPGAFYTTLHRMETEWLLEPGEEEVTRGGRRRQKYQITDFGRRVAAAEFNRMRAVIDGYISKIGSKG